MLWIKQSTSQQNAETEEKAKDLIRFCQSKTQSDTGYCDCIFARGTKCAIKLKDNTNPYDNTWLLAAELEKRGEI